MINTYKERYVNNELFQAISWPQYINTCHLTSLTAIFNYFYSRSIGIRTVEEIEKKLKLGGFNKLADKSDIGNQTLIKWFCELCCTYECKPPKISIYSKEQFDEFKNNETIFGELKKHLHSLDAAIVYHMDNHYNVVLGYAECAREPSTSYSSNTKIDRWIILGDHSTYVDTYIKRALDNAKMDLKNSDIDKVEFDIFEDIVMPSPIWVRRWGSIRVDVKENKNHCLILFEKG